LNRSFPECLPSYNYTPFIYSIYIHLYTWIRYAMHIRIKTLYINLLVFARLMNVNKCCYYFAFYPLGYTCSFFIIEMRTMDVYNAIWRRMKELHPNALQRIQSIISDYEHATMTVARKIFPERFSVQLVVGFISIRYVKQNLIYNFVCFLFYKVFIIITQFICMLSIKIQYYILTVHKKRFVRKRSDLCGPHILTLQDTKIWNLQIIYVFRQGVA